MGWTERQQRMLGAMGLRVWTPAAQGEPAGPPSPDEGVDAAAAAPAPAPAPRPVSRPAAPVAAVQAVAAVLPQRAAAPGAAASAPAGERETAIAAMDWPGLREAVAGCQACTLCQSRTQTVFGVGHAQAHWMIVGEAPGENEDLQGEPFVGAAGQLLDAMLRALKRSRQDGTPAAQVYIANTLKCRPPRNRNPQPEELAQCEPYLKRQIALVQPKVILAMGKFAIQQLLGTDEAVGRLRGKVHQYQGVPVVVTYHPAYLLRQLSEKAKAWEDLKLAQRVYEKAISSS
jgi:uracil-DNA glycosylase